MSARHESHQKGQALIEAVFIILFLIGLLFSIEYSGRLRAHSIELLGQSSFHTFLQTREKKMLKHFLLNRVDHSHAMLRTFERQLLDVHQNGLIKINAKQDSVSYRRSLVNRIDNLPELQRSSYLYINAGDGYSATDVRSRIENSRAAWLDTANSTRKTLIPHIAKFKKIDSPWGRENLQTDWLGRWSGQVPAAYSRAIPSRRVNK